MAIDIKKIGVQKTEELIETFQFVSTVKRPKKVVVETQQSDNDLLFSSNNGETSCLTEFKNSKSTLTGEEFWNMNSNSFPSLYALYLKLCPLQLSNAGIERLFSQSNLVYDKLCGQMDTETIFAKLVAKKKESS